MPHTSPSSVFIGNLKLLQFDLRADWPGILPETLSGNQHNTKRRIQAVEWSLYQLFMIWNADLTQNKLQPYFPPLEPLQSSNLRNALFRLLSELKKNGTLARETILRRTMFDECQGEKFEEILADFSTVVLRKVALATKAYRPGSPSLALASASKLSPHDRNNILPLIITYRSALHSMIKNKNELNSTCRDLKQFFQLKANELSTQSRQASNAPVPNARHQQQFQQGLTRLWNGDKDWAIAILNETVQTSSEPLLEMSFSQMWSGVTKVQSQESSQSQSSSNLLAELDDRVSRQQLKLQKLREFRLSLGLNGARSVIRSPATREASHAPSTSNRTNEAVTSINGPSPLDFSATNPKFISKVLPVVYPITPTPSLTQNTTVSGYDSEIQNQPLAVLNENQAVVAYDACSPSSPGPKSSISVEAISSKPHDAAFLPVEVSNATASDQPLLNEDSERVKNRKSRPSTLMERTRQSMLILPTSASRVKQSASASRRLSQFPVNQFETPQKNRSTNKNSGNSSEEDADEFDQYTDYDSVFKSRPRVVVSPVQFELKEMPPPARPVSPKQTEADFGFHHVDIEASPLAKKYPRKRVG
ncbi:hypothetical protein FQN57_005970 [Myotisia sp. PD_48]|nr:hypothetical protein FQN57_005970 [Myotisia sp. PD_48]